jgi:hypothetical protein
VGGEVAGASRNCMTAAHTSAGALPLTTPGSARHCCCCCCSEADLNAGGHAGVYATAEFKV